MKNQKQFNFPFLFKENKNFLHKHENKMNKRELLRDTKDYHVNQDCHWSSYLEENSHVLYGSKTPIFVAKRNKSVDDPKNRFYIEYHREPFVS